MFSEQDILEMTQAASKAVISVAEISSQAIVVADNFKTFRNAVDFITSPEGLGLNTLYEHIRQYQYVRDFHQLLCPQCNHPTSSNDLDPFDCWGRTPLEVQSDVLFEYDAPPHEGGVLQCPQCGVLQSECELPRYNTIVGIAGMRSGKTYMSAALCLYELHKDLLIDNPQKTWGLGPGQPVYYTLCSTKSEQAKDTVFGALDGLHENSPWFNRYINTLRRRAKEQHIPFERVYVHNTGDIQYLHKQLFVDNTGANSAGIAGKTRKVVVMDEIARFIETESRMGVDLVYDTLRASLLTLSNHNSKMICISSPMFRTDKIMRLCYPELTDETATRDDNTFYFHQPTWLFNPKFPRNHPFICQRFSEDPVAARRDYGAEPPGAKDPWIPDEEKIDECVDHNIPLLATLQDYEHSLVIKASDGSQKRTDLTAKRVVQMDYRTTTTVTLACDPGHLQDSFGMVMGYLAPVRTARGIENHLFLGMVAAWEPSKRPKREVDFKSVLEVIKTFKKHWELRKVVYDQWQSVLMIQDLVGCGVDAEKIGLRPEDWEVLRSLIYNHQVHLLPEAKGGKAAKRLIWELKNLQMNDSGKVDHSEFSSSDIAVCLARLAKSLLGEEANKQDLFQHRARKIGSVRRFRRP